MCVVSPHSVGQYYVSRIEPCILEFHPELKNVSSISFYPDWVAEKIILIDLPDANDLSFYGYRFVCNEETVGNTIKNHHDPVKIAHILS